MLYLWALNPGTQPFVFETVEILHVTWVLRKMESVIVNERSIVDYQFETIQDRRSRMVENW